MASTTKGLFARGIGIDTTNYTTDGLFVRGFQKVAVAAAAVGKYARQHATAYALVSAAADKSYADKHARAYALVRDAGA